MSCVALGSGVAGHPERVADCFGGWEVAGQADGVCGRGGAGPCVRVRVGWGCGLVDGLPAVAEGAFVACHACELFDASDVVVGCSAADAGCEAGCVRVQAVEEFASGHWVMAFRGRAASSLAERVGCVLGDLVACPGFVCGVVLDEAEGVAVAAGLFPSVLGPGGVVDRFGVEAAGGAVAGALLACPGHGV